MKSVLSLLVTAIPFAFAFAPLPFEIATALLFGGGLLTIALHDYTQTMRSVVPAPTVRGAVRRHRERLGLAA
jgi:hypothetical protein